MKHYKMIDVVSEISERENSPSTSGYDRFVGLEHYISGEVEITNYGTTANLDSAMKVFHSGDILVARRNVYLKRASVVFFDGLTSGDSIVLRAKDGQVGRLLPFVLNTDAFWDYADQYSDGTMSKRLSPKTLMQYEFDLPDEDQQDYFADTLWAAVAAKASYQRLLIQTVELLKAQFIEMFGGSTSNVKGWPIKKVDEIYAVKSSKRIYAKELQLDHGIPFMKVTDLLELIDSGGYFPKTYISEERFNELRDNDDVPCVGDILVTSRGTIGKCYIIQENDAFYFQDGMISWLKNRANNALLPEFMVSLFSEDEFLKQVNDVTNKTTVTYLSLDKLACLKVICPPVEHQQVYLDLLHQADKSKAELKQAIESISGLI